MIVMQQVSLTLHMDIVGNGVNMKVCYTWILDVMELTCKRLLCIRKLHMDVGGNL